MAAAAMAQTRIWSSFSEAAQDAAAACSSGSHSFTGHQARLTSSRAWRRVSVAASRSGTARAVLADRTKSAAEENAAAAVEQGVIRILEHGMSSTLRDAPAKLEPPPAAAMGRTDTGLESTLLHRVWTGIGSSAVLAVLVKAGVAAGGGELEGAAMAALGLGAGYVMADLGSGIYHWGIDNYGDARSPVFGSQIDAFQGHHQRPWTITKRAFCNNTHAIARPVALFLAPFLLLPDHACGDAFLASFLGCILLSQQFHAWAHSRKSRLPPLVVALQDWGVLVGRKMHGAHHRSPYDINYCIVSGVWNPVLDSNRVFPRLERAIFRWSGVRPRSWSDTLPEWVQETPYFEDDTETDSSSLTP